MSDDPSGPATSKVDSRMGLDGELADCSVRIGHGSVGSVERKHILALDTAGITGWARDEKDLRPKPRAGMWDVSTKTYGTLGRALLVFYQRLRAEYDLDPFELLVYEAPIPFGGKRRGKAGTNQTAIRAQHARGAVCEMFAASVGIPVYEASPQTCRRYFTGNAKADKQTVWDRCRMLGWIESGYTMDTTDAIAVLAYARGVLGEVTLLDRRVS